MDNGQNINDWGDQQMTVANTRIPYASTLAQTEDYAGTVPGGLNPNGYARDGGQLGGPGYPAPQSFIRGEKQWIPNAQNIEDWGIQQMTVANTRIPYASTLVQTSDKKDDDEPDMSILYEKEDKNMGPEKIGYQLGQIPLDTHLVQMKSKDDDVSKIEGMMMEDPGIPINLRLLQTKQDDDAEKIETMAMEDPEVPLNYRLIHVETKEGELIRMMN